MSTRQQDQHWNTGAAEIQQFEPRWARPKTEHQAPFILIKSCKAEAFIPRCNAENSVKRLTKLLRQKGYLKQKTAATNIPRL